MTPAFGKASINYRKLREWPDDMRQRLWLPGQNTPCELCSRPSVTWWAPDDTWALSVAARDGNVQDLCLSCFTTMAQASGRRGVWQLFEPGHLR